MQVTMNYTLNLAHHIELRHVVEKSMHSLCCGQNKGRLLGETLALKAITLADFLHQGSSEMVPGRAL